MTGREADVKKAIAKISAVCQALKEAEAAKSTAPPSPSSPLLSPLLAGAATPSLVANETDTKVEVAGQKGCAEADRAIESANDGVSSSSASGTSEAADLQAVGTKGEETSSSSGCDLPSPMQTTPVSISYV